MSIPQINSTVAYIANAQWIVPAKVLRAWPDGKLNLEISDIQLDRVVSIQGEGLNVKVDETEKYLIKPSFRPNVVECDPCSIIRRNAKDLDRVQEGGGLRQAQTDTWDEIAKSRLPKLTGMATSLIGKWFDPSRWNYQIYCYMEPFENKILHRSWDAIELILPNNTYRGFEDAFTDWFKEAFESRALRAQGIPSSWSRCEIQAVEKPEQEKIIGDWSKSDVQVPVAAARNKRNSPSNPSRAKASKSRSPRSKASLRKA